MTRSDLRSVSVTIDGEQTGIWDMLSGGEGDSEETKYRAGGGGKQENLGGPPTRENITVARLFKLDRDLPRVKQWDHKRGRAPVVVTEQFLDRDGNVASMGLAYRGLLKRVAVPEHDSESTDASRVELEISLDADSLA
jgi:hypothetical protein